MKTILVCQKFVSLKERQQLSPWTQAPLEGLHFLVSQLPPEKKMEWKKYSSEYVETFFMNVLKLFSSFSF